MDETESSNMEVLPLYSIVSEFTCIIGNVFVGTSGFIDGLRDGRVILLTPNGIYDSTTSTPTLGSSTATTIGVGGGGGSGI
jgi:hypothetical protein